MPDTSKIKAITGQNIQAWEEAAPLHAQHNMARLLDGVRQPGFSCLNDIATDMLRSLQITGKDVAQLGCNNGCELLSIKIMGAGRCVGFDGAQGFLDQGAELAQAAGQEVTFVCCDAYDVPDQFHQSFDLVVITIGVLGWMPDIDGFFAEVSKLLRPGGAVFVYEHHPVLMMAAPGPAEAPVEWELSYFDTTPYVDEGGLDYYGGQPYKATPNISFLHKTSDILMACVNAGMTLEHFKERPEHISNAWWNVEASDMGLPMSYTLVVRKPA